MTHRFFLCILWWQIERTCAFYSTSTPLLPAQQRKIFHRHRSTRLPAAAGKADAWAAGKNAAPAVLCDIENVPLLDPVPDGHKRLFLVRHGEVINPGGDRPVYYGAMDVPLSPLGELEAIEAASYLANYHLQHVASSPLSRAQFGARQVLARQDLPAEGDDDAHSQDSNDVRVLEGFRELDRGAWCGLTAEEIGPAALASFEAGDAAATPGAGGESYAALCSRVLRARDDLLVMTAAGRASAVVSHLQVTRALLCDALGLGVAEMAGLRVATASVSCVDYAPDGTAVVRFQSFKPECGLEESKDGAN